MLNASDFLKMTICNINEVTHSLESDEIICNMVKNLKNQDFLEFCLTILGNEEASLKTSYIFLKVCNHINDIDEIFLNDRIKSLARLFFWTRLNTIVSVKKLKKLSVKLFLSIFSKENNIYDGIQLITDLFSKDKEGFIFSIAICLKIDLGIDEWFSNLKILKSLFAALPKYVNDYYLYSKSFQFAADYILHISNNNHMNFSFINLIISLQLPLKLLEASIDFPDFISNACIRSTRHIIKFFIITHGDVISLQKNINDHSILHFIDDDFSEQELEYQELNETVLENDKEIIHYSLPISQILTHIIKLLKAREISSNETYELIKLSNAIIKLPEFHNFFYYDILTQWISMIFQMTNKYLTCDAILGLRTEKKDILRSTLLFWTNIQTISSIQNSPELAQMISDNQIAIQKKVFKYITDETTKQPSLLYALLDLSRSSPRKNLFFLLASIISSNSLLYASFPDLINSSYKIALPIFIEISACIINFHIHKITAEDYVNDRAIIGTLVKNVHEINVIDNPDEFFMKHSSHLWLELSIMSVLEAVKNTYFVRALEYNTNEYIDSFIKETATDIAILLCRTLSSLQHQSSHQELLERQIYIFDSIPPIVANELFISPDNHNYFSKFNFPFTLLPENTTLSNKFVESIYSLTLSIENKDSFQMVISPFISNIEQYIQGFNDPTACIMSIQFLERLFYINSEILTKKIDINETILSGYILPVMMKSIIPLMIPLIKNEEFPGTSEVASFLYIFIKTGRRISFFDNQQKIVQLVCQILNEIVTNDNSTTTMAIIFSTLKEVDLFSELNFGVMTLLGDSYFYDFVNYCFEAIGSLDFKYIIESDDFLNSFFLFMQTFISENEYSTDFKILTDSSLLITVRILTYAFRYLNKNNTNEFNNIQIAISIVQSLLEWKILDKNEESIFSNDVTNLVTSLIYFRATNEFWSSNFDILLYQLLNFHPEVGNKLIQILSHHKENSYLLEKINCALQSPNEGDLKSNFDCLHQLSLNFMFD